MAFSTNPVKLRSLGLWSFLLATLPLCLGGCIIVEDNSSSDNSGPTDNGGSNPPITQEPKQVSIDTGSSVKSEPGEGVGIFVEYAAGGKWRVWTSCDTNTSKVVCTFDLYASVDTSSKLSDLTPENLEGPDEAKLADVGVAYLHAETASETDGMTFTTTPGAIVRLEAYLDGESQPRFVYWFGDGVLHTGAPTNPIDFKPSAP